jgi:hypothetical protein
VVAVAAKQVIHHTGMVTWNSMMMLIALKPPHWLTHADKVHSMSRLEVTFSQQLISTQEPCDQRTPLEVPQVISWQQ